MATKRDKLLPFEQMSARIWEDFDAAGTEAFDLASAKFRVQAGNLLVKTAVAKVASQLGQGQPPRTRFFDGEPDIGITIEGPTAKPNPPARRPRKKRAS